MHHKFVVIDFDKPNHALMKKFDWWGLVGMAAYGVLGEQLAQDDLAKVRALIDISEDGMVEIAHSNGEVAAATTEAPRDANRSAVSRPIPCEAPVITTT